MAKKKKKVAIDKKKKEGAKKDSPKATFSISPLADRIVVRPFEANEVATASGIIIPDTVDKEKPARGTVVAVGPGKYDEDTLIPMSVKVGDTVLFSKYEYDEVKVDGAEYYILQESSVLGILKK